MKLQKFGGGLATRLEPQLISIDQGVVYENIDNAYGILRPVKDKLATEISVAPYNVYFSSEDEWVSSSTRTDYLEYQNKLYLTNRTTRPQKYSDGTYNYLGIEGPSSTPALTAYPTTSVPPLEDLTVLNQTTSGDLPTADFSYMLFNVDSYGYYSKPFKFTVYASDDAETSASGEVSTLSGVFRFVRNSLITETASTPRSVLFSDLLGDVGTTAKIFRYYDGAWRLVGNITKSTTLLDDTYDISANTELDEDLISPFDGTYQYVYTYYNSDDGTESVPSSVSAELEVESGRITISNIVASSDPQVDTIRLYRVGNNITQFSLVVELSNTNQSYLDALGDTEIDGTLLESDNYYPAPAGLSYLTEAYAMLFGAVGSTLRFTPIGLPNAWPPEFSLEFVADITGIGQVSNGILVFTRTKTYVVTGTGPYSLAQQLLRGDQGCIKFESIVEATAGTLIWASEDGLCTSSGNDVQSITKGLLGKIDLTPVKAVVNNEVYYCLNEDGTILASDYRFTGILKHLDLDVTSLSTALGKLYGYKDGLLYELFEGSSDLTFKYKSPRFTEGTFSAKTYKKVYIRYEGDIIIKIIIDDEIVASFDLTGTKTAQLQVPQQKQRGYSIQFEIEGTGAVQEIEYTAEGRHDG